MAKPTTTVNKRAGSRLTERQEAFVDAKMLGMKDKDAGIAAGAHNASNFVNVPAVREELAAARRWLTDTTQIKRLDIVEGLIDGIEMARMQGDSANVIKGWVEVGKMLGHYAPEVKRIELSLSQERLRSKFEELSDAELMAISEGRVIDGTCTEES